MPDSQILLIGEPPVLSSPSLSLASALGRVGIDAKFAGDVERRSTKQWLEMVRGSSAVVLVQYDTLDPFLLRQLSLATCVGVPLFRWWVGSDVLRPLRCVKERAYAHQLQRICSGQITVSPHLVDELASVGITACFVPSVLDSSDAPTVLDAVPKRMLAYLPTRRRAFYGGQIVKRAAQRFPDVEFLVVADAPEYWKDVPNVRCYGWVENLESIWNQVGGLLRVTEHDGLPRMVLDALRRGKHVLYSWPLEGCVLTGTEKAVFEEIDRFRQINTINIKGIEAVQRWLDPAPEQRWKDLITSTANAAFATRLAAAKTAFSESIALKWQNRRFTRDST